MADALPPEPHDTDPHDADPDQPDGDSPADSTSPADSDFSAAPPEPYVPARRQPESPAPSTTGAIEYGTPGTHVPRPPSVAAVVVLSWVLPGSGYLLLHQRGRGLTIGSVILTLFFLGLLIGGITVIDTPGNLGDLGAKPWFIGQALTGPVAIFCAWIAHQVALQSHARSFEIGTLYTAVAGMLNLLAMIDSGYRAATLEAA